MPESGITDWELDLLIRGSIIQDIQSVRTNFEDIYELIEGVSQLPIHKHVASLIENADVALHNAVDSCEKRDFVECVRWMRRAHHLSHSAAYDSSMLPNLYFSAEFTYAVYSPYFLPGYIPIIAGVFKYLKAWKKGELN